MSSIYSLSDEIAIMRGIVPNAFIINKFGRSPDVDGPEDIWNGGGFYSGFPTGPAETLHIFSSSVNDTAAGTGLRTGRVYGEDNSYNLITEDVTLNGTSAVTTTQSFKRVYRFEGLTAGSNEFSVGDITVRHSTTTANVFAVVHAGFSHTNTSIYTIPAGYSGYLRDYSVAMNDTTANSALIGFYVREFNACARILFPTRVSTDYRVERTFYGGYLFPEKTDIAMRVLSVANTNADIVARFDLILFKN